MSRMSRWYAQVRIPVALRNRAKACAAVEGKTLQRFIEAAIKAACDQERFREFREVK